MVIPRLCTWLLSRLTIELNSWQIRNIILNNRFTLIKDQRHSSSIRTPLLKGFPEITQGKVRLILHIAKFPTSHRCLHPQHNQIWVSNKPHKNITRIPRITKHKTFATTVSTSQKKIIKVNWEIKKVKWEIKINLGEILSRN